MIEPVRSHRGILREFGGCYGLKWAVIPYGAGAWRGFACCVLRVIF